MKLVSRRIVYSPTDLCTFLGSRFASWMDRYLLENPGGVEPDAASEDALLVQRRGNEHEHSWIEQLEASGADLARIPRGPDRERSTVEAMREGRAYIHQAALSREPLAGFADLLVRVEGASALGDYHYIPCELKLAFRPKPKHLVQLCAYAEMLEAIQQLRPDRLRIVLGNRQTEELRTGDFFHYYTRVRDDFVEYMAGFRADERPTPEPGAMHGRWRSGAEAYLQEIDHLSRVANIRSSQITRLEACGITTVRGLAESKVDRVARIDRGVFWRLRRQARLQLDSEGRDRPLYEVLTPDPDRPAMGLALLPPSCPGDVFFDMEGYPLVEGGLEYLFGAVYLENGEPRFRDWWAHDGTQERSAFCAFVDWIHARWRADPSMHVYHYAAYELTALRKLMGRHGAREAELDRLFRAEVFVDLYTVVRHGLMVGEPRYSIKNLERLYREARDGDVETAVDSIVQYQRWLDGDEPQDWRESPILRGIRDYNRDDCESTWMLAEWLRGRQRELGIAYRGKEADLDEADTPAGDDARRMRELAEEMLTRDGDSTGRLLGHLVEFHRREEKPMWWEMFHRHSMSDDELYEDLACLGKLTRTDDAEVAIARSKGVWYAFDPDQDSKLGVRNKCYLAHDLEARVEIDEMDADAGRVMLRFGPKVMNAIDWPPPRRISLIPDQHIPATLIQQSIQQTARSWITESTLAPALGAFLGRMPPSLRGHVGGSLAAEGESPADAAVRMVGLMEGTTLSVQGPPGSGKTHTAARMILDLLERGKRVGITSNGHKAILNLMAKCVELNGRALPALKVGGAEDDPMLARIHGVQHVGGGAAGASRARDFSLVGGTAWLFSRRDVRGMLDYLFIDEAGQVSVANLVAMAPCTDNVVLVGDQMQLAQPIQGSHPEDSGASTLEHLLEGRPTIPPDRGLFLDVTYRLHPDICKVNSEAFYEGKLRSAPGCENRRVVLDEAASEPGLREAGIVFVPVEHEGNTQGSDEEADVVLSIVRQLLGRKHTDRDGSGRGELGLDDILVVAPYNMQVRKLQRLLPEGIRVGSVDKFQGQEAPVVIVSMCASEAHDSPRGIEFLLNPNRLNVALSRAQSLAVVVGSPAIAGTRCSTIEQMRLVNLYCRIVAEG